MPELHAEIAFERGSVLRRILGAEPLVVRPVCLVVRDRQVLTGRLDGDVQWHGYHPSFDRDSARVRSIFMAASISSKERARSPKSFSPRGRSMPTARTVAPFGNAW